tara:strand:+ start:295 stop:516 length:222 start_codon:yes stop_codon:yes gene_type:complete
VVFTAYLGFDHLQLLESLVIGRRFGRRFGGRAHDDRRLLLLLMCGQYLVVGFVAFLCWGPAIAAAIATVLFPL